EAAEAELRRLDAARVVVGGGPLQDEEFEDQVGADLARAELLSMPVVLVLLLVVFGGIVAAGLPVLVALVGVAGTLLALLGISSVTEVSVYSVNVVTMLGLGLAIDYALLLVSRFREERATRDLPAAIEAPDAPPVRARAGPAGRGPCDPRPPGRGPRPRPPAARWCSRASPWRPPWPACWCSPA